jgi:hypothetical protein
VAKLLEADEEAFADAVKGIDKRLRGEIKRQQASARSELDVQDEALEDAPFVDLLDALVRSPR